MPSPEIERTGTLPRKSSQLCATDSSKRKVFSSGARSPEATAVTGCPGEGSARSAHARPIAVHDVPDCQAPVPAQAPHAPTATFADILASVFAPKIETFKG